MRGTTYFASNDEGRGIFVFVPENWDVSDTVQRVWNECEWTTCVRSYGRLDRFDVSDFGEAEGKDNTLSVFPDALTPDGAWMTAEQWANFIAPVQMTFYSTGDRDEARDEFTADVLMDTMRDT
jgi:hypothetical protein